MRVTYGRNESVAYDLEKFQPRRLKVKNPPLVVSKPNVKARAKRRAAMVLKVAAVIVLGVGAIVIMLYSRAVLTELNQKIDSQTAMLGDLRSEQTRLSAQLEAKVSLRNVEEYASQTLGMAVMDKNQVTYVTLSDGDQIELTSESPKQTLVDRIKRAAANVREVLPED